MPSTFDLRLLTFVYPNETTLMLFDYQAIKEILRCPKSRSPLVLEGTSLVCTDAECRLKFAIRDDIPILLLDEATELAEADWRDVMDRAESAQ